MPELPEVEAVAAVLREELPGEIIEKVTVRWPQWTGDQPPAAFGRGIRGKSIIQVARRGKYLRFWLDDQSQVWSHLRMTGRWLVDPKPAQYESHCSALLRFVSGRHLAFVDVRKFGRAHWYPPQILPKEERLLGPEPLDPAFDAQALHSRLAGRRRELKTLLLDQQCIAGLGNIYASEILFRARVSPMRRSDSLTLPEARRIHQAMVSILELAIEQRGTTVYDYRGAWNQEGGYQHFLQVYQKAGEPCPRCRKPIVRLVQGQRSTFYCPTCQR